MKIKHSLLVLFILAGLPALAQKTFEEGYFIDNSGKKTSALLRTTSLENLNAKGKMLEYKASPDASASVAFTELSEIGIGNDTKLKKVEIALDDANLYNNFPSNKYPDFTTVTVFLNVLVEGDASLYVYESSRGNKYFYTVKGKVDKIEQLLYKKYVLSATSAPREVSTFRQQMQDNLGCPGDASDKFFTLRYDRKALLEQFNAYNNCHGSQSQLYGNTKKKRSTVYFTALGGAQMGSGTIKNVDPEPEKENSIFYNFGLEAELRNSDEKWGLIARVEFESPNFKFEVQEDLSEFTSDIRYHTYTTKAIFINPTIGGRLYFNPEAKSKIFCEAGLGFSFPVGGKFEHSSYIANATTAYTGTRIETVLRASVFFAGSVGYVFSDRLGAEVRATIGKNPANTTQNYVTFRYSTVGINLRYTL